MGRRLSYVGSTASRSTIDCDSLDVSDPELEWPFGPIDTLRRSDVRETAYELFFMSCRSSPGFGTRGAYAYAHRHSSSDTSRGGGGWDGSPPPVGGGPKGGTGVQVVQSRIKRVLGLRTRRSSPRPMRSMSQPARMGGRGPKSPVKRPLTSAEIMRQQMRVTEQSDSRLRKTLMRTLVGQVGRRAETIILPLELLRQLKPSEFTDMQEYHQWQRRQLKILEAGLLLHPSTPHERLNSAALRFREVISSSEAKPIDTGKNSDAMRTLCTSVMSLAWRANTSPSSDACHWADGFPLNVYLYISLLRSIFDLRDETAVLDEVDELVELMKKTWSTLGVNRMIHNVCLTWVLFYQYVATGQVEPDLIGAALAMLVEVANDAKRTVDVRDPSYIRVLSGTLVAIRSWADRRLVDYHELFNRSSLPSMENLLNLALSASKILTEDVPSAGIADRDAAAGNNRVDFYIRSTMRNAFTRVLENCQHADNASMVDVEAEVPADPSELLTQLAKETEELAVAEQEVFSPTLRRWHGVPGAVAVATLHGCFGVVLRQYLARASCLSDELVRVLHSAGKLERVLVQMVVEDAADCDDGGKGIVREMVPYDVDSVVVSLLKAWVEERLRIGRECLNRAQETESWIPRSKAEPFAQSAVDLTKLAKVTVDEFFEIPVAARDDMVQDLAEGIETLFRDYTAFVSSCGSKQSYIPNLPPLTRCNQESRFVKLWKMAAPCKAGAEQAETKAVPTDGHEPRPSTSRGTQRLYIRLNTLHYLSSHIQALDKSLSFLTQAPAPARGVGAGNHHRRLTSSYHFDLARSSIKSAIQQVSEVAAYRLVFLDSHRPFSDGLYVGDVANARIRPTVRILKQNLALLVAFLTDQAQPMAAREVMRASFEAFLLVLLAGGSERVFVPSDYEMVMEDFKNLKRVFCTSGEGLVAEDVVDREAEVVEGIVELMGLPTERLVEEFCIAACECSGGVEDCGEGQRVLPMPPTTGRWNRADLNTVLRVLCHRNDDVADQFLKRTFQLPKRR